MMRDPTQKEPPKPESSQKPENKSFPDGKNGRPPASTPQTVAIKPGFYLVATPIGNLRDMTFRALDILASVDLIVCEDTRVTGKLMQAYGFKKKMQVYNDHATPAQREALVKAVQSGLSVAVLSDAGMPLVSDPGYKLVQLAIENDLYITTIPGPNAVLPALQLSGLPSDQFSFLGFLPAKTVARKNILQNWAEVNSTLIVYETGPRLLESLKDMHKVLGQRPAAIVREMTKIYEEARRGTLTDLIRQIEKEGAPKGEIVVVIGQPIEEAMPITNLEDQIKDALRKLSVRDAAELVAGATGKPKKTIYTLALKLASDTKQ